MATIKKRITLYKKLPKLKPGHAAAFSKENVSPIKFDYTTHHGGTWLSAGAALLRAGRAVLRQTRLDFDEGMAKHTRGAPRMAVAYQAIFLAAFALENALKGVIAESLTLPGVQEPALGELPKPMEGHNLVALVTRAKTIGPSDPAEQDAINHGQAFTTSVGRYPVPLFQHKCPEASVIDVGALFEAYERLYLKCVNQVALARFEKLKKSSKTTEESFVRSYREGFEWKLGGVDPTGRAEPDILLTMHGDGVTLTEGGTRTRPRR